MDLRFKFGEDTLNYDTWRPNYVNELFEDIFNYGKITNKSNAVEIGCGTGLATLPFLKKGCSVHAVDVDKRMTLFIKQKYADYKNLNKYSFCKRYVSILFKEKYSDECREILICVSE